jgi:hypothetical protein
MGKAFLKRSRPWLPLLSAALVPIAAFAANSVPFPELADPTSACYDPLLGPSSPVGYNVCINNEQEGYDNARAVWDQLSQGSAQTCLNWALHTRPFAQYAALGSCAMGRLAIDRYQQELNAPPKAFNKW